MKTLKVYNRQCKNCLCTKNRIVSEEVAKNLVHSCIEDNTHFICHKASLNGEDVMCKGFYDKYGPELIKVRLGHLLNIIEFVDLPDNEKLTPYKDYEK